MSPLEQLTLAYACGNAATPLTAAEFNEQLRSFNAFGSQTECKPVLFPDASGLSLPMVTNEFWTAKQRAANPLHEISYRACFKPQLPRFFIERLTRPGDIVYDPFMGRGTTLIEAALLGRVPFGSDVNPLSQHLVRPRLLPPTLAQIEARLADIDLTEPAEFPQELLVFYHPETLKEICALKHYLIRRKREGTLDSVDEWICLMTLNRLTGHSACFLSVYTLPPNQAVSIRSQEKINRDRNQVPSRRQLRPIVLKKSRSLLKECDAAARRVLAGVAARTRLFISQAAETREIPADSVTLVVTSPPFLNVVDYATDNWLRCWFLGIDAKSVALTVPRNLDQWKEAMTHVFSELKRVLQPAGWVAFEVGEVHGGKTKLEEAVLPCGMAAGLHPELIMINQQEFTKTSNCWGVDNGAKGTNTNRVVLFQKRS